MAFKMLFVKPRVAPVADMAVYDMITSFCQLCYCFGKINGEESERKKARQEYVLSTNNISSIYTDLFKTRFN